MYSLSKLMQRICEYGDIQNNSLTADEELNIVIYWTPSYVMVYRSYTLSKIVTKAPNALYTLVGREKESF